MSGLSSMKKLLTKWVEENFGIEQLMDGSSASDKKHTQLMFKYINNNNTKLSERGNRLTITKQGAPKVVPQDPLHLYMHKII